MRIALLVTFVVCSAVLTGCSATPPPVKPTPQSSLASRIPLAADNTGQLSSVGVTPGNPMGIGPGTPEAAASERYGNAVDVSVFSKIRGVDARLVVPMWYSDATTYTLTGPGGDGVIESRPLAEAAKLKDGVVWWAGPKASITYHFEDGYFVLDSLKVPASH